MWNREKTIRVVRSLTSLLTIWLLSSISLLWRLSCISPFGPWATGHCTLLMQSFQSCPLLPLGINPSAQTRKFTQGLLSIPLWKANSAVRSLFPPSICWESVLGFRSRAESFRSRRATLLSLANAFYLAINKEINYKSLLFGLFASYACVTAFFPYN